MFGLTAGGCIRVTFRVSLYERECLHVVGGGEGGGGGAGGVGRRRRGRDDCTVVYREKIGKIVNWAILNKTRCSVQKAVSV